MIQVEINGLDKFLKAFEVEAQMRIDRGFQEAISYLIGVGEPIVPINTGVLRESVYMKRLNWDSYTYGYYAVNPASGFVYSYWREYVYPQENSNARAYLATIMDIYNDNAMRVFKDEVSR